MLVIIKMKDSGVPPRLMAMGDLLKKAAPSSHLYQRYGQYVNECKIWL